MNTTYKLARLSDAGNDLTKAWVVVYYVWSVRYQRQVRKRVVINGDTIEERNEQAKAVIRKINKALKAGMVTHVPPPPKEPSPIEAEVITNVLSAVDHFLKVKKQSLKSSSHKTYRSRNRKCF